MLITAFTYIASLIGGFTGVALGKELDIVEWIFAATAGMFLYIALVELVSIYTYLYTFSNSHKLGNFAEIQYGR